MRNVFTENRDKWIFAGAAIALFLVFRYVFPLIWPFLLGALLAAALYPCIRFLHKRLHIGKGICAVVLLAVLVLVILGLLGLCGYGMVEKGYELVSDYATYMAVVEERADVCCDWIETQLHLQSGSIMRQIKSSAAQMAHSWQDTTLGDMFAGSVSGMKKVASVGLFFVFLFLSTILIVKEWDENRDGIFMQCKRYADKVIDFLKIFLGAQLRIIGVIALICLTGLWLAKIDGAAGLAVLTACMDVVPFIGTGIILVPLILWKVVNAQYYQAFLLLATYICCMIAREYLEPKFISAKTGISPVLTLLGIYVGVRLMGFAGIFLGPLYILMLQILYEELVVNKSWCEERD